MRPSMAPIRRAVTEAEARKLLGDHGYPDVKDLSTDAEGNWSATAVVNGKPSKIGLSREGKFLSGTPGK